jgi:hypothetical protein
MSDPFDTLFEGLRGQRPPAPFAPPAAVRRRGRQRANRQAVSIGVAVLAMTGLGAGGVVAAFGEPERTSAPPAGTTAASPTEPAPSPSLRAPQAVTEIPDSWPLTAEDLPGTGWVESDGELLEGPWFWTGTEELCPGHRFDDTVRMRVDARTDGWLRDGAALPERIDQLVELFPTGLGVANVEDVREFIEYCSRRPDPGDQVAPTYYEIEETGFAGDESLLIRAEYYMFDGNDQIVPAGEPEHVAVVRVGDAVTTIRFLNRPDDARTVAMVAADRMR